MYKYRFKGSAVVIFPTLLADLKDPIQNGDIVPPCGQGYKYSFIIMSNLNKQNINLRYKQNCIFTSCKTAKCRILFKDKLIFLGLEYRDLDIVPYCLGIISDIISKYIKFF